MTNEELLCRYEAGDTEAQDVLYKRILPFIRSVAKEVASDFNCLQFQKNHPDKLTAYTKTILQDLCGEGNLEFLLRLQSGDYDESRGKLTTYLYPYLKGRMYRWLEQNIGNMALSKDEMAAVRQAQRLYHRGGMDVEQIAAEMGILAAGVCRHLNYGTHFFSVHDMGGAEDDGDIYERLLASRRSAPVDRIVYHKICIELLKELFNDLPKKDRDILGKCYGVFGFQQESLYDIGMYHMMKESAVEKAKNRALEKLRSAYPGSKLQRWREINRMMRDPIPPSS